MIVSLVIAKFVTVVPMGHLEKRLYIADTLRLLIVVIKEVCPDLISILIVLVFD